MNSRVGARTVLITGASSGLGEEMARQFATLGYDLALCARRTERLETLTEEIRSATGRRVETATLDVTDHDAVRIEGVDVSVIYPGYIRSEMNSQTDLKRPFMVDTEPGVRTMVKAIEKRRAKAYVPAWPWAPLGAVVKVLPLWAMRKLA